MKISVVTIVYNDRSNIGRTMDSVLGQTARQQIEYLVIDGASTDGTSDLIRARCREVDVYVCEKDRGIYDAMNKGIDRATGDYVLFMNSGDCFTNNRVVEEVIQAVSEQTALPDLVYGNYRECQNGSASAPIPSRHYSKIWYGPVASHQSTFYNLHFLNRHHLSYDLGYKIAADYKLTLTVVQRSEGNILQLPLCISDFDITGVSNNHQDDGLREANRARREILGWGKGKEWALTVMALTARYAKRFLGPLYGKLRRM